MFASVAAIDDNLARCFRNYADERWSLLELLRFLGKHPYTRFSRAAIVNALRQQGVFVERALKYLVETGLITVEAENNINLYSLASKEPMRSWAEELVRLDWRQWQSVLRESGMD